MSKKRAKSHSGAGQGGRWEAALVASPMNDDNWNVCITFIVENQIEDTEHLKPLAEVIKLPQRRLFSVLSKDDLMEMVEELGNPKVKKTKEIPQFFEVTEIIKGLMDADQDIPIHMWAKLIKFGLLNIKDKDLKRRENEAKLKEGSTKGKGSGKKRPRSKSPGKSKGKKTPDVQMPKKDWSTLKKRGDDSGDDKYIDDEPDDGPKHYIFVTGFHQPQVFPILTEMDVNVNGIIKITSENYETMKDKITKDEQLIQAETKDADAVAALESKKEIKTNEIALFWKLLPHILKRSPPNSTLQDLANLHYTVTDTLHPTDWNDPENLVGYGTTLFEDLACLVYDSLDWRRQYLNYVKNMKILHVPKYNEERTAEIEQQISMSTDNRPSTPASKKDKGAKIPEHVSEELVPPILSVASTAEVDMRYYNDLMAVVPQESVSVPIILHCMIEQIEATQKGTIPPSEVPRAKRTDGIHFELSDCITEALMDLPLTEEEKASLAVDFPETLADKNPPKSDPPTLLLYGDDCMMRTHHLKPLDRFNVKEAEEQMMQKLPLSRLRNGENLCAQICRERATRLQELLQYCTVMNDGGSSKIISNSEMDRAFKQFVFETMNISAVEEQEGLIVKPTMELNAWDDPYMKTVSPSPDIKDTLNVPGEEPGEAPTPDMIHVNTKAHEQLLTNPERIFDSWNFAEHFQPDVLLQVLTEAMNSYPELDVYHQRRDNSVLAMFHCPMNKKLMATKKWFAKLHSDVGFRNYLEHISSSIAEWTKSEEYKHEAEVLAEELKRALASKEQSETTPSTPPPSTAKRPRSKSPKKGSRKGSASRSSSKGALNEDSQSYSSPYIRTGSLKAQSEEQSKMREAEEKLKAEKESRMQSRQKSAGKKAKSAASKTSQEAKRPGSGKRPKSGKKSKSASRSTSRENLEVPVIQEPKVEEEEKRLPFVGYDVGNNIIHVHGTSSYLFPCDGGIVQSEKLEYEQGKTLVTTSVLKDGHKFLVHLVDPCDTEVDELLFSAAPGPNKSELNMNNSDITEKSELEKSEKESLASKQVSNEPVTKSCHSAFGSWVATLCDGMTLSMSSHGENGTCDAAGQTEELILQLIGEIPSATSPSPVPPGMETPKGKKGKGKSPRGRSPRGKSPKGKRKESEKEQEAQRLEEQRLQEELELRLKQEQELAEEAKKLKLPPFQKLYVSSPDGLAVRYQLDPQATTADEVTGDLQCKLMVRQSYPYKTSGQQDAEKSRSIPAMQEMSRLIRSDGTVIKLMLDGSTKVLFSDGSTYYNAGSGPLVTEDKAPMTPHSLPSAINAQQEEIRNTASAGSKKGSKGRKSSGKTATDATTTEPSMAGTAAGGATLTAAAGLEADAGAKAEADQEKAGSWLTTVMEGEQLLWKPNGDYTQQQPLLAYNATDPVTAEILTSREDHVIRVVRPDNSMVCDHNDGTRITVYNREVEKTVYDSTDAETASVVTATVQHVRVECPGFATVTFNCDEGSCCTTFGSGTTVIAATDSTYQLSHWNGGRLEIDQEAAATYTPRPDNDLYANYNSNEDGEDSYVPENRAMEGSNVISSYVMRHNAEVCLEAVDQEGNVFQVDKYGAASVINPTADLTTSESGATTTISYNQPNVLDHHPPRLFVIYSNGSGTELLRYKDVHEYLMEAELDPSTAVIREPLPDMDSVIGITVMRPHFGNSGDAWLIRKAEDNIIPENIRSKHLSELLPNNNCALNKENAAKFATTLGKGLAVGTVATPPHAEANVPIECPKVLELRQLVQYAPMTPDLRSHLHKKLVEFGDKCRQQDKQRDAMKVLDPRSEEEKIRASDLLSLVLEFDDQPSPRTVPLLSTGPEQMVATAKAATNNDIDSTHAAKTIYEDAVRPPPIPKPQLPKPRLTAEDWERIGLVLKEEQATKLALKNRDVPAYFYSEEGKAWLARQNKLKKDEEINIETNAQVENTEINSSASNAQPKTRPTNPTPVHAGGTGTPTSVRPENPSPMAASQTRTVRPSNPTPIHASASRNSGTGYAPYQPSPIPELPTSAQVRADQGMKKNTDETVNNDSQNENEMVLTRSLLYNHSGQPRKEKVRLPASILSDKPIAVPNKQFLDVENPVRRKVNTSSVAGSRGKVVRGFQLLPPEVVFGVLKEGNTYSYTVRLKNTGVDTCRYKIKQPPPGTGLRVHYAPGPIAAGMDTLLHIECYAIAVGVEGDSGVGVINHQLEIVTEIETLYIPISAIVLTTHAYEKAPPNEREAHGVKHISSKAPSRDVILRPFKVAQ